MKNCISIALILLHPENSTLHLTCYESNHSYLPTGKNYFFFQVYCVITHPLLHKQFDPCGRTIIHIMHE